MKIVLPQPAAESAIDQWGYTLPAAPLTVECAVVGGNNGRPFGKSLAVETPADAWPDRPFVVVQGLDGARVQGLESLVTFTHPDDAVYYFGRDIGHMTADEWDREPDHIIYVPTKAGTSLYSAVAFWTVMYDLAVKSG